MDVEGWIGKNKKLIAIVAIAFLVYYLVSGIGLKMTLISVSSVQIQPQGSLVGNEWKGSYWIINMYVDCNDQVGAYTFTADEAKKGTTTIGGKTVLPSATITIKLTPQKPYYEHSLERFVVNAYPKTYSGWVNKASLGLSFGREEPSVSPLDVTMYRFSEGYWTLHTPFVIEIQKNGTTIYKETWDSVGGTQTKKITNPNNPEEWLLIKDLGKVDQSGWKAPTELDNSIIIGSLPNVFSDSAVNYVKYDQLSDSFSQYWFGPKTVPGDYRNRWDDGSPSGIYLYTNSLGQTVASITDASTAPGWDNKDDFWTIRRQPKAASVDQIVTYVKGFFSQRNVNVWGQGYACDYSKLKIYMPVGAASSQVQIQISTELADAIVWEPPTSNVKIVGVSELGEIQDRKTLEVTVKQESTVAGTAKVSFKSSSASALCSPEVVSVSLEPGQSETVKITVINLGADTKTPFTVDISVSDAYTGIETDRKSISGTLLPKATAATSLIVETVDAGTDKPISGIPIQVTFDSQSLLQYTMDGVTIFDLQGIQGKVTVEALETYTYNSYKTEVTISPGVNRVTLKLTAKGTPPLEIPWLLIIAAAVGVSLVAVYAFTRRRK